MSSFYCYFQYCGFFLGILMYNNFSLKYNSIQLKNISISNMYKNRLLHVTSFTTYSVNYHLFFSKYQRFKPSIVILLNHNHIANCQLEQFFIFSIVKQNIFMNENYYNTDGDYPKSLPNSLNFVMVCLIFNRPLKIVTYITYFYFL